MRPRLARLRLDATTAADVARWRDERLHRVKPGTVVRDLTVLQSAIDHALGDDATMVNVVKQVRRPSVDDRRERRLHDDEWQVLMQAADQCGNMLMRLLLVLALETGMRRGELLSMEWQHIDFDKG